MHAALFFDPCADCDASCVTCIDTSKYTCVACPGGYNLDTSHKNFGRCVLDPHASEWEHA